MGQKRDGCHFRSEDNEKSFPEIEMNLEKKREAEKMRKGGDFLPEQAQRGVKVATQVERCTCKLLLEENSW